MFAAYEDGDRLLVTSKLEGDFTYLQFEIVTFKDLWLRPQVSVEFLDRVCETLNLSETKLEVKLYRRWDDPLKRPRSFGCYPGDRRWRELQELLTGGELARIFIVDWQSTHSRQLRFDSDIYLGVHFGFVRDQACGHTMLEQGIRDPQQAKVVKLCVNTRIWESQVPDEIQTGIVGLAQDLFTSMEGACGYVDVNRTYSFFETATEHERQTDLVNQSRDRLRLCDEVRGTFWGNLLSHQHVEKLRSAHRTFTEAPVYQRVSLKNGAEYLQVTPSLDTADIEAQARLSAWLEPVLISADGQLAATVLDLDLLRHLGGLACVRAKLNISEFRITPLPHGELLVEYVYPAQWPAVYEALQCVGCAVASGYRSIPQLRRRQSSDDIIVWGLRTATTRRPRHGPVYPPILVEPCLVGASIKIEIAAAEPFTPFVLDQLVELVSIWEGMVYEMPAGTEAITSCAALEETSTGAMIQATLVPVGQDAYLQLVLMLDDFSKNVARLRELHVWPGDDCG